MQAQSFSCVKRVWINVKQEVKLLHWLNRLVQTQRFLLAALHMFTPSIHGRSKCTLHWTFAARETTLCLLGTHKVTAIP